MQKKSWEKRAARARRCQQQKHVFIPKGIQINSYVSSCGKLCGLLEMHPWGAKETHPITTGHIDRRDFGPPEDWRRYHVVVGIDTAIGEKEVDYCGPTIDKLNECSIRGGISLSEQFCSCEAKQQRKPYMVGKNINHCGLLIKPLHFMVNSVWNNECLHEREEHPKNTQYWTWIVGQSIGQRVCCSWSTYIVEVWCTRSKARGKNKQLTSYHEKLRNMQSLWWTLQSLCWTLQSLCWTLQMQ